MAIPVGQVDERGESGLIEFLDLAANPDFADTVPADLA